MKNEIPIYDISSLGGFHSETIMVSRFGPYSETHRHLHYPHRHNFYHVLLFTGGAGSHSIDFENFEVQPWQIYFMIPGQVHSWGFEGAIDGYVVNFSDSYFQSFLLHTGYLQKFSFFNGVVRDSVLQVPGDCRQAVGEIFEELLEAGTGNKRFRDDYIRVLLLKMFIMLSDLEVEKSDAYVSSYNYVLLKNFQQLIERNYTTLRRPKDYAELLYITPNH